ncbi:retrovirus-related Pol polyprotein from [Elysia marginata]|uniref:Retrovirus-related Pol polyprotein from n=1 Tax=Elysia marginata TaxID=1093978 RepID=A0AAV4JMP5_9GAST|nr:retrovirus-related Pol polyprotein from [Elysia marginata]
MWNGSKVRPLEGALLDVRSEKTGSVHQVPFTVVENSLSCLLGLSTAQRLGLVTFNTDKAIASVFTKADNDARDRGNLIPVEEPTPWVSQMAIVEKANGGFRLCIDPRPLNDALQREHLSLPTSEDVLPELSKAKSI